MADNCSIGEFDLMDGLNTQVQYDNSFEELRDNAIKYADKPDANGIREACLEEMEKRVNNMPLPRIDRAMFHVSAREALVNAFLKHFGVKRRNHVPGYIVTPLYDN